MPDSSVIWKSLAKLAQPPAGINDETVQSSFLSKLFHYKEGRNSWWGSWSSSYPGDSSFHLDQDALKMRIESRRKQGSQFSLAELPALTLAAKSYDLHLLQTWGSTPFEKIPVDAITGRTAFEIARSICKHEFRITAFIAPSGQLSHPVLPFKSFISSSQGTRYHLNWDLQPAKSSVASIMKLVADVTLHLNNER